MLSIQVKANQCQVNYSQNNTTMTDGITDNIEMLKEKYIQACETWRFLIDIRLKIITIFFTLTSGLFIAFSWFCKRGKGCIIAIAAIILTISAIGMEWRCRMLYRIANKYAQKLESSNIGANDGICHILGPEWYKDLDIKQELMQNLKSSFNLIYILVLIGWLLCLKSTLPKH